MTAASAPAAPKALPVRHRAGAGLPGSGRLLRLELRHNAMLWLLPLAVALFWFNGYREIMALPPMWNLRAMTLQNRLLLDLTIPVTGASAWMGSREGRRNITDLVGITARPRWARQLATWAATTAWAEVACLGCVGVVYAMTARQASWGGPLWWPAAVSAAGIPALTAIGFAAGAWFPGRLVTPLITVAVFFGFGFSTQAASGDHSYWQISPLTAGAFDIGAAPGVGTFYHYLPDLSIAQVMFTTGVTAAVLGTLGLSGAFGAEGFAFRKGRAAGSGGRWLLRLAAALTAAGLAAAGTAVALAGTGRLDPHGMIVIPALHDAASDQPVRYTPDCSHTTIPVCLNPAYSVFLPAVAAVLGPELTEVAGLPGAPARISQVTEVYRQEPRNGITILTDTASDSTFILPDQLPGQPGASSAQLGNELELTLGLSLMRDVILGDGTGPAAGSGPNPAELAVIAGSVRPVVPAGDPGVKAQYSGLLPAPGSPVALAGQRFAELSPAAKHAWLAQHLAALRAGRISLAQLP
jgi:hypothetical protein